MIHLQPVELAKNGSVAPGVSGFAPGAGTGAAAEVNGCLDIAEPFDNLVNHIDTEISGAVSSGVVRADFRVNKQAKVRVVNLNDSDAFLAQELDFAAQDGDAIGDERLTRGIGGAGFFGRPTYVRPATRVRGGLP